MKIDRDTSSNSTTYTLDGATGFGTQPLTIRIQKGGEVLDPNTYGFEIEFCSQDSPVFGYTHVPAMTLNVDGATPWKVETDSGDVFEIVSPPLAFPSADLANQFKLALAKVLLESVRTKVTVEVWAPATVVAIRKLLTSFGFKLGISDNNSNSDDLGTGSFFEPLSWDKVSGYLIVENIDDDTDVEEVDKLMVEKKDNWPLYVGSIQLSRSTKDEERGFSSQLNMPMTLPGYFMYTVRKYLNSVEHFEDKSWGKKGSLEERIYDKMENWYWRSVLWRAMRSIKWGTGDWLDFSTSDWTLDKITRAGILYVTVSKILTGALGALSEGRQLEFQKAIQKGVPYGIKDRGLRGYHSFLKNLTGLWFKAPLFSVLDNAKGIVDQDTWIVRLAKVLDEGQITWPEAFGEVEGMSKRCGSDELVLEGFFFGNPTRIDVLIVQIRKVEKDLAGFLRRWVAGKLTELDEQWIRLPPRDELRKRFLHYSEAAPWEGRFDTMYPSVTASNGQPAYLIEHRFN